MKNFLATFLAVLAILAVTRAAQKPDFGSSREWAAAPKATTGPQRLASAQAPIVKTSMDWGRMPLYFIANKGQMDGQVAYYVQGADKTLYFTSEGVTFLLTRQGEGVDRRAQTVSSENWVVKLDFVGANRDVRPIGEDETGAVVSYFSGQPKDWRAGVRTYSSIVYANLWPGIDLVYSGTANQLKYEFIVHPGADPSLVRLAYRGATDVIINESGRLEVTTPVTSFQDDAPVAYQEIGGKKVPVSLAYNISDSEQDARTGAQRDAGDSSRTRADHGEAPLGSCVYSFEVGDYDGTKPLILDPAVLVYCGYVGGSGEEEQAGDIAVDGSGCAYITGTTTSTQTSLPVTVGPDLTHNGGYDVYVAKVNALGTGLAYCGYIGGLAHDYGLGIAVDSTGSAYVVGNTYSTPADNFPVTVGPSLTFGGSGDAFVAKINASGTALVYSGYIGGEDDDGAAAIAVDSSGNAYVTGRTESDELTFPVTVGPDLSSNGGIDAFIAKINAAGTGLASCGFIGGSGDDLAYGIAVDTSGSAYITGQTNSIESTFPIAVGPGLTYNGGFCDGFVAKVNGSGTTLVYCGYVGTSADDVGMGIAVDSLGRAYVCGGTDSSGTSLPVTVGPDLTANGGQEGYVARLKADGSGFDYLGYIGGSSHDWAAGIALDSSGCAYINGTASSSQATFPVRGGPDLTHNGGGDAYVAKVRADGTGLVYCGYVGGSTTDLGAGIAVDGTGSAYIVGQTNSSQSTFPVTVGPDLSYNGNYDSFVAKISYWDEWTPKHAVGDFDGDGKDEAAVDFGVTGIYLYDSGAWSQISSANPESLVAADVDGDTVDEILADLGSTGLWLWNAGAWNQLSGVNIEGLAVGDVDADGADEVVGDFGNVGLWLYGAGIWTQISGVNADYVMTADLDGTGGDEIVGDFGATGLWVWNTGAWTQLSGVNADYLTSGRMGGTRYLVGDFGPTGLWLWNAGAWTQLSGVDADYMITANTDGDADDELVGDFGATGLWLYNSGAWTILSGLNADFMIRADVDGSGSDEIVADFGTLGLWLWNTGAWTQQSGVNPEYLLAADVDGDNEQRGHGRLRRLGSLAVERQRLEPSQPSEPRIIPAESPLRGRS